MKTKLMMIMILSLAFLLRVWQINLLPFGFTPDEASFGYDAYSILKTGRDQWGHFLPLTLESFGDFKLPLYSYITIPSVALFGLNVISTRLPNAIFGTLAVLATFLMVREFLRIGKLSSAFEGSNYKIEVVAAFLLAISPWHIMMSRGAFEANLTTLLMPLGVYFFVKGLKEVKFLSFSALVFGLNLFSYHSARLVTPLILALLVLVFRKELAGNLGYVKTVVKNKISIFIFAIFLGTAFYTLLIGGARRAQDITIFVGATETAHDSRFPYLYQGISQDTARIFVNKYQLIFRRFFENYSQYFSPKFLVIDGPSEATYGMIPGRGVSYWFDLVFIVLFFFSMSKSKDKRFHHFILLWLLLSPIPAALTVGKGYTANRAETMLPALTVMAAIGFVFLNSTLFGKINKVLMKVVYFSIVGFSLVSFSIDYFVVSPYKTSEAMLWGNLDASYWLSKNSGDKEVVVSRKLSEPHMYIAFANVWDPIDYQSNSKNWEVYREKNLKFLDQLGEYKLGKYTFTEIDINKYQSMKDILLVGKHDDFPSNSNVSAYFVAPNGRVLVQVVNPHKEVYASAKYGN